MSDTATELSVPVCPNHGPRPASAGLPDHPGHSGFAGTSGNYYLICCDCQQRTHNVQLTAGDAASPGFAERVYTHLLIDGLLARTTSFPGDTAPQPWGQAPAHVRQEWESSAEAYRVNARQGNWHV